MTINTYAIQDDSEIIESFYTRRSRSEKVKLEGILTKYYELDSKLYCEVVNSGMAAITTSIESI